MRGVDVSVWNYPVDWGNLKRNGIEFAICRTGYGRSGYDETFALNVAGAHEAGLICGAYHYSYALNEREARQEAVFCKGIIERAGVLLELPVWFDMEDADGWKVRHGFTYDKLKITGMCEAFLSEIKPLKSGIYASYSWLEELIDWRSLGCSVWNAQWGRYDFIKGYMWQYTDGLRIGGAVFDGNILYETASS